MTPQWIEYFLYNANGLIVKHTTIGGSSRQRRIAIRRIVRNMKGPVEVRRAKYDKGTPAWNSVETKLNCSTI